MRLESQILKDESQLTSLELKLNTAKRDGHLPHLIIVDQVLNRNDGVVRRGSSVAVALRAQAPEVPIVGVTAAALKDVAELQKDQFIEFFDIGDMQSGSKIPDLFAIAEGFPSIAAVRSSTQEATILRKTIFKLLRCPKQDVDFLSSCLPGEFITPWDDERPHAFARWIWHVFTARAGFLYDDLEIATLLGVNISGLESIIQHISGCEYLGTLQSESRRRWWVSKVRARSDKKLTPQPQTHCGRLGGAF